MSNQYEITAAAIRYAEEALNVLNDFTFTESQQAKGKIMMEQIIDYITHTLSNANYMCSGCKHYHLALSNMKNHFVFYIYDSSTIGGFPAFVITPNGEVKNVCSLSEWMMLTLVKEWEGFKKELDFSIKTTMKMRTKSINDKLAHIGYVNEQLSKWHV